MRVKREKNNKENLTVQKKNEKWTLLLKRKLWSNWPQKSKIAEIDRKIKMPDAISKKGEHRGGRKYNGQSRQKISPFWEQSRKLKLEMKVEVTTRIPSLKFKFGRHFHCSPYSILKRKRNIIIIYM